MYIHMSMHLSMHMSIHIVPYTGAAAVSVVAMERGSAAGVCWQYTALHL